MSLNWKEIDLVLAELDLSGSQIQKVTQPAFDILVLDVYKTGSLRHILVSLTPGACRLHETANEIPKPVKPLRFAEFMKSRIVNGWIDECVQLGSERIVRFSVRRGEEHFFIYARLWSNAANIIVTDADHLILDVMRRSPKRGEIGGKQYSPEDACADPADAAVRPSGEKRKREYEVREYPALSSFNASIDVWYSEHAASLSLEALREQVKKIFSTRMGKLEAAIYSLEKKFRSAQNAEQLKEQGDILMANLANIEPGAEWFEGVNFYNDTVIRIHLDTKKTPAQNAEQYYELYKKSKSGIEELGKDLESAVAELEALGKERERLLALENPLELNKALQVSVKRKQVQQKKRPGVAFASGDWLLLVGRDASENDELLRYHVKGPDMWLHTRDVPGGYVFIKARKNKSVPLEVLIDAGNLAVFYSKARNSGEADLYYTFVKYLRRAKKGPKGLVLPSQEKNLHIKLDADRLRRLEQNKLEE
jgi:predicted ribosome quality control (RQC) complex YloA/Tae2 family protein